MSFACFYIGMSLWLQVSGVGLFNMEYAERIKPTETGLIICTHDKFCFPLAGATVDDLSNCGKDPRS